MAQRTREANKKLQQQLATSTCGLNVSPIHCGTSQRATHKQHFRLVHHQRGYILCVQHKSVKRPVVRTHSSQMTHGDRISRISVQSCLFCSNPMFSTQQFYVFFVATICCCCWLFFFLFFSLFCSTLKPRQENMTRNCTRQTDLWIFKKLVLSERQIENYERRTTRTHTRRGTHTDTHTGTPHSQGNLFCLLLCRWIYFILWIFVDIQY